MLIQKVYLLPKSNNRYIPKSLLEPQACDLFSSCYSLVCELLNTKNATCQGYSVISSIWIDYKGTDCPHSYTEDYAANMFIYNYHNHDQIITCNKWSCVIDNICKINEGGAIKGFCT